MRLSYARVLLVEVNVDSELPKEVVLDGGMGDVITINVDYPWIPITFSMCKSFGHPSYA